MKISKPAAFAMILALAPVLQAQSAPATAPAPPAPADVVHEMLDGVRIPLQGLLARPDLSADDLAIVKKIIAAEEATAKELAATLPAGADTMSLFLKGMQLQKETQEFVEPHPHLDLLYHQENGTLAKLFATLSDEPPEELPALLKKALDEPALGTSNKIAAQLKEDVAAIKRDAEKPDAQITAAAGGKPDSARTQALYLSYTTAMQERTVQAAFALRAALSPAEWRTLQAEFAQRTGSNYFVTFSNGIAPIPAPLDGTYEVQALKDGHWQKIATTTVAKNVPLSFKKTAALAGDKEFPIGEGLHAWVLVGK